MLNLMLMRFASSLAILSLALVWAVGARAEIIEQILVKVNGEIFTKTDLETRQVAALRQMQQTQAADEQLRRVLAEITPQIIVSAVDEMLIVQRGIEQGLRLGDEQFQSILDGLKKDNKIETDEQFQAALKQENMTLAELRKNIERQMLVSRVQQNEVVGRINVSEEEVRAYYNSHLEEFRTPQSVTLREILVSVSPGAGAAAEAQAREKADAIRRRALAGESFETLASELSDAPSRANAGLIGPLNVTDLSPELQNLIRGMKTGQISDILQTSSGLQVLKLESSTDPETTPFEQAREAVSNRLFEEKRQVEALKFLEKLRAEAIIDWKNEELRKAYELGIQQQKAQGAGAN
jgi:parvulin-like peptidyl-prolyl isomerase